MEDRTSEHSWQPPGGRLSGAEAPRLEGWLEGTCSSGIATSERPREMDQVGQRPADQGPRADGQWSQDGCALDEPGRKLLELSEGISKAVEFERKRESRADSVIFGPNWKVRVK